MHNMDQKCEIVGGWLTNQSAWPMKNSCLSAKGYLGTFDGWLLTVRTRQGPLSIPLTLLCWTWPIRLT
jgi:hypothetical protein